MERNLSFDTEGLEKIAVHLGWAQLEMFADEVDKVQVMAAVTTAVWRTFESRSRTDA